MNLGISPAGIKIFNLCMMALTAVCGAGLIFSTSCASRPNDETVTTLPRPANSPMMNARIVSNGSLQQPAAVTPARDLEAAGDNVARALVRLRERNRHAALEALDDARPIINSCLAADIPAGNDSTDSRLQLEEVVREITEARSQIEHGDINRARRQLYSINIQLDRLTR